MVSVWPSQSSQESRGSVQIDIYLLVLIAVLNIAVQKVEAT